MSLLSRLAVGAARAYGALAISNRISADFLVVAGGGGAGDDLGGAGGAGGFRTSAGTSGGGASAEPKLSLSTLNTYSIVVGAGGAGSTSSGADGINGGNSSISGTGLTTITSIGGGGGAGDGPGSGVGTAQAGGSGGGAASGSSRVGGAGTANQGYAGGTNPGGSYYGASAGGGGAGAAGTGRSGSASVGGNGGNGVASSISGSSVTYAGGGAGGTGTGGTAGTPGTGGGGTAGSGSGINGGNGGTNLGGGGGGGSATGANGGSGGSGIVIISYTSATPRFVGGTITTSGGKQIHTFTSSGTLSPITPITAEYLVVAGGGSGGSLGGGGAGGFRTSTSTTIYSGATYVVTVGAGGSGSSITTVGNNGSDSSISGTGLTTVTSTGGGAGGGESGTLNGNSGGSGGGSGGTNTGSGSAGGGGGGAGAVGADGGGANGGTIGSGNTPSTSPSQGNNGGRGGNSNSTAGNGGAGSSSSISGTSVTYAGGGGGGSNYSTKGTGGSGGGGDGGQNGINAISGTTNTGGGGGGRGFTSAGNYQGSGSGSGGSGIVIISYAGSQQFNGGLVTSSGGNTIHTFTSTGALTPLTNNLNNSLRFRSSASAYLNRTPTVAGSQTTWTWSAWVKRGSLTSTAQVLFEGGTSNWNDAQILFENSTDALHFIVPNGSSATVGNLLTTQAFRDPSAWYHIVVVWDSTQATAANRMRMYVNGIQITAFSTATYPSQNQISYSINGAVAHNIGRSANGGSNPFDGYMADINFIDGQALEPYYFGNNDANGVWKPIQYKGTYGTNGFYLTFGNTTSTTTLGYDSSPNGNNWTCNNISLTAGTTYDAMTDVPTNTSATVANYGVINPLSSGGSITNGNLTFSNSGAVKGCKGSFALESGKWYWENTITTVGATDLGVGIIFNGATDAMRDGTATLTYGVMYQANTNVRKNGTVVANYASYTTGDVIGIAYDADTRSITFYKNNTSQGSITADEPTSPYVALIMQPNTTSATVNANFGQRPFSYTPPTGYVALNTYNLPTPTILQGNKYMDATLYTGTGTTNVAVNQGQFKPDFLWVKDRSRLANHILVDSVRGVNNLLRSESTAAEIAGSFISSLNSNGFTLSANTISDSYYTNVSGDTFVGWQWQAGQGSTSSNTSGTITSTVSVNTTAGFSIISWTSTGSNGTIGHGLGVAPVFIIARRRNTAENWIVYHKNMGGNNGYLLLNGTGAFATGVAPWNSTDPTSSVISINNSAMGAGTSNPMITYAWAEIAGFSKFGSYTGNGSADGPFIYTGFRPKFILFKVTSEANGWVIYDTSRDTYNYMGSQLYPHLSNAETVNAAYAIDATANGFKIRTSNGVINVSSGTFIYAAFAEHPFKNSNAR